MRPSILLLPPAVAAFEITGVDELFPPIPSGTSETWRCAAENVTSYWGMPRPTGELSAALLSYETKLYETCTLTGLDRIDCPSPDGDQWCGFTAAAPKGLVSGFSVFAHSMSDWWGPDRLSSAVEVAEMCPIRWYNEKMSSGPPSWLNDTFAFSACAEGWATKDAAALPTTTAAKATTGAGIASAGPKSTATATGVPNNVGRAEGAGIWVIAATALAAAAAAANVAL